MTNSHLKRLEQLQSSADQNLDTDLIRDRRRLIADSFRFLELAWEMDAETHQRLRSTGSVPVGEIVELYVTGTAREILGIDQNTEEAVEITFAAASKTKVARKLLVGFFIPKGIDQCDPQAIETVSVREGVYTTQITEDDLSIHYWVTEFGSEPFIIPDEEGASHAGNFSALDGYSGQDAEEIIRAREATVIASLRESIATWELVPAQSIRKIDGGFESVIIPS